jgi:glycine oxidase
MTARAAPDVVVIGAGIAGLSVAWGLAQRGAQVVVIDPAPGMGCGASGAAAGVLAPPIGRRGGRPWGCLEHAAWDAWPAWARALEAVAGHPVGWRPCGLVRLRAQPPRMLRPDQTWYASARACEPTCRGLPDTVGALGSARGGMVDPLAVLAALRSGVHRAGGRVVTDSVTTLAWHPDGRVVVTTAGGAGYVAPRTIVAAGVATPGLLWRLRIPLRVQRDAGATLDLDRVGGPTRVVGAGTITLATGADGSVVVTGARWGDGPPRLTLARQQALQHAAAAVLGAAGVVRAARCGVRVRGAPHPMIGSVAGDALAIVTGLGGQGYLLAPLLDRLVETTRLILPVGADAPDDSASPAAPGGADAPDSASPMERSAADGDPASPAAR